MSQIGKLHKVVVCRNFGPDAMSLLKGTPELDLVVWPDDLGCDRAWLMNNIPDATGVIVTLTDKVNTELLNRAGPSLKVVSTMSVGHGIAISIAQNGEWPNYPWAPFAFCGPQLSTTDTSPTRKVGFLGFGRIAQATLARLVPFGITHCLYTSNPTSPTNHQRDAELAEKYRLQAITKMKKTSVLVNVSRGTLVDSDALAKALKEGWIWGAGLDVMEGEPNVTIDHPLVKEPR
ncbi:hypothetical protein J3A83DRAFT_2557736 [Scleroderma citrinum]